MALLPLILLRIIYFHFLVNSVSANDEKLIVVIRTLDRNEVAKMERRSPCCDRMRVLNASRDLNLGR